MESWTKARDRLLAAVGVALLAALVSGLAPGPAASAPSGGPLWTLTQNPEPTDFSQPGSGQPKYLTSPVAVEAGKRYTLVFSGYATETNPDGSSTQYDSLYQFRRSADPSFRPIRCCIDLQIQGHEGSPIQPGHDSPAQIIPFEDSHQYKVEFVPPFSGALEVRDVMRYSRSSPLTGSLTFQLYAGAPTTPGCGSHASAARAGIAAINEVHVADCVPGCWFHKGGFPADAWLPVEVDTVLKAQDEVSCDPDGTLTLAFADNATVVLRNATQFKIGSYFTDGGVVRAEIVLRMGEVAAQVNKSAATKSDFRITSPTFIAGVRGTKFTVFYDPGSRAGTVSTAEGAVAVTPTNSKLRAVTVIAGREVEVTRTSESRLAAIGKAGARGGIDRARAHDAVAAVVANHDTTCHVKRPYGQSFAISPAPKGWLVTLKLPGAAGGTSKWRVAGTKVRPANAVAKRLARRC